MFVCMCECMPRMYKGLRRLEVGTTSSGAGVIGNCKPSCMDARKELNLNLLEEQIEFLKCRAISPDLHRLIYLFHHELLLSIRTVNLKLDT